MYAFCSLQNCRMLLISSSKSLLSPVLIVSSLETHIHTYTLTHIHTHTHTHIHTHAHTHTSAQTCTHTHTHVASYPGLPWFLAIKAWGGLGTRLHTYTCTHTLASFPGLSPSFLAVPQKLWDKPSYMKSAILDTYTAFPRRIWRHWIPNSCD